MTDFLPDLALRPRLASLSRLGGNEAADPEIMRIESSSALEAAKKLKVSPPERFVGRVGYVTDFLTEFPVSLPVLQGAVSDDLLPVPQSQGNRLDYLHFSVVMSKSRKIALFVGVNIDGQTWRQIQRDGDTGFLDGHENQKVDHSQMRVPKNGMALINRQFF